MISRLRGTLLARGESGVELATSGGVVYEIAVPLPVAERLPPVGEDLELLTVQVVRDDGITLYGFLEPSERTLFRTVLGATGVGPKLALGMLSTYTAPRLARALAEKDLAAMVQIPSVGRKTAERIVLELSDKVSDLVGGEESEPGSPGGAQEAVGALVALGMSFPDADRAVRAVLNEEPAIETSDLIRRALALK